MSPQPVFVDTVALLALANKNDNLHERAKQVLDGLTREAIPLLTSDWILTEFLGGSAKPPLRTAACRMIDRLSRSARTTIIAATRESWKLAFGLYSDRTDKAWSLVDCSSILHCREHDVRRVFTHDRHFVQAGFEVLLP